MKKLLLFDVDGTLIDYDGTLPKSTKNAISKARENGNLAVIVTGRSRSHIEEPILEIGFDGIVGGNGAYIELNNKIIKDETIPVEDVKRIVDYLNQQHLEYYIEANMSKYLASIIDIINHDVSVEKVRSSNEKIMDLMKKVNEQ